MVKDKFIYIIIIVVILIFVLISVLSRKDTKKVFNYHLESSTAESMVESSNISNKEQKEKENLDGETTQESMYSFISDDDIISVGNMQLDNTSLKFIEIIDENILNRKTHLAMYSDSSNNFIKVFAYDKLDTDVIMDIDGVIAKFRQHQETFESDILEINTYNKCIEIKSEYSPYMYAKELYLQDNDYYYVILIAVNKEERSIPIEDYYAELLELMKGD